MLIELLNRMIENDRERDSTITSDDYQSGAIGLHDGLEQALINNYLESINN